VSQIVVSREALAGAIGWPHRRDTTAPGLRSWLFVAWLLFFFTAWSGIVVLGGLGRAVRDNWPISVAMAGGSFVGGSSPVAGGTVGFPVLVYVFDHPARLGRDFCLAIQSVGMVSASIYILSRRRRVEWRMLRFALIGAALAMPVGMWCIAPAVADVWVKILFSVVYASFGLLHLARLREIVGNEGPSRTRFAADPGIGLAVGALGGILASVIGVGADILLYGALVLLYRTDIRIAIPTAVILMAFTSLMGAACGLLGALWRPVGWAPVIEVVPYWAAAAPVVAVGGPLGSLVSRFVPRRSLLGFVAALCLGQYALTCYHERIAGWSLVLVVIAVIGLNLALHGLFEIGRRSLSVED
jgi:uncharacterized membrane protein YfcA